MQGERGVREETVLMWIRLKNVLKTAVAALHCKPHWHIKRLLSGLVKLCYNRDGNIAHKSSASSQVDYYISFLQLAMVIIGPKIFLFITNTYLLARCECVCVYMCILIQTLIGS